MIAEMAQLLFSNQFTPVCSLDLIRHVELRESADLLKLPILTLGIRGGATG
jgi:hypothetical protein